MNTTIKKTFLSRVDGHKNLWVFGLLWVLTFAIYIPAAKAGWVLDSAGWLKNIRNLDFWDYINNAQSGIPSLYQFTQFTTYIFYKIFNANPYAWHGLMVSMHAANAFLFFILCSKLFDDSGIKNGRRIALAGVILYTVCPHISEVVVWEAAYHYLQGFLLILLILLLTQRFIHVPKRKYVIWSAVIYFCATYSLEIFYLTPWFVLTLGLYYRFALDYSTAAFKKVFTWFVIPQLIFFVLHIFVLRIVYDGQMAHLGQNIWQPFSAYICKPPRYIFHILFLGRFFPNEIRQGVYQAIGSNGALIAFYNIFILVCVHLAYRFNNMQLKGRAGVLLFAWAIISMGIIMPLAFPDMLLLFYDRYTYFLDAFVYMLLALLASYIAVASIKAVAFVLYGAVNILLTTRLNLYWKHSTYIDNRLLKDFPDAGGKTVILLNVPQCMNGLPMIGAEKDGAFDLLYKLFVNKDATGKIYDVAAYNMLTKEDGAHVYVHNDSLITVTLNQWGTWWWYERYGAYSYENEDYKLDMKDMGHWYDLTLKHPSSQYLILYQQGEQWKRVNMKKSHEQQY